MILWVVKRYSWKYNVYDTKGIKMEHTVATDPKEIKYIKKRCRKAFREKYAFTCVEYFRLKRIS